MSEAPRSPLPLVTLVTPTYNQAGYLAETIECVLAQDYPEIEYIVLDDGSTDATPEVLARYADRVRVIRQSNMGQARTLNKGWEMARGKYIGYLSSDDLLEPCAVRRMIEPMERDDGIVCAFPDSALIDDSSKVVKQSICRPFDLESLIVRQECYIGPGAFFRRDAFLAAGGWRPELKLAPDRELWMRLARRGRLEFVRERLAGYRIHPQSISYKTVSEEASREYFLVLDEYFARPDVPAGIAARRDEAYGHATLIVARNALRAGRWRRGLELYGQACRLHPPLSGLPVKLRLLRNVVSKPARVLVAKLRFGR
jgi:glycosyltransferase involved in cell wall biosynthesis